MAYVHGEMSEAEARAFTQALSQDEALRLEVEELLQSSQALTSYFAAGTNEGLDPKQLAAIRKKAAGPAPKFSPWWYLAGGLVAASIAAVVTIRVLDTAPPESEIAKLEETLPTPLEEDPAMIEELADADGATAEQQLAEDRAADEPLATEEDLAKMAAVPPAPEGFGSGGSTATAGAGRLGGLAKKKADVKDAAAPAKEAETVDAKKMVLLGAAATKGTLKQIDESYGGQSRGATKSEESHSFSEETESPEAMAAATESVRDQAAPAKVMHAAAKSAHGLRINKTKSTISPNLSKDTVFEYLRQTLESGETCVPSSTKVKALALILEINREGRFTSVKTEPVLPQSTDIVDCIKLKLQDSEKVLTPTDKGPARAKIQIELQ